MDDRTKNIITYVEQRVDEAITILEVAERWLTELRRAKMLLSNGGHAEAADIIHSSHCPLEVLDGLQDVLCRAAKAGEDLW